jgi:hypothetical protein
MVGNDWGKAAAFAAAARDGFAAAGDHRGCSLAATHLLMCQLGGADVPGLDVIAAARELGSWGAESGSFSFALGLGVLFNRFSRHWLLRRGHYERALACSRTAQALFDSLGARINAAQCRVDQGLIHQAAGERSIAFTLLEGALDEYRALADAYPSVRDNLIQRQVFLATEVCQLALQQTDPDRMERAAWRLAEQLDQLPAAADMAQLLEGMIASFDADQPGREGTLATDAGVGPDPFLATLRPMVQGIVDQSAVLAPLYRARRERARGLQQQAQRHLEAATAALGRIPGSEQNFLAATVLAEREDYAAAADAVRRQVAAGGANAGFSGQLTEVAKAPGTAPGTAQAALQDRRTHEQAFSAFVAVRAYDDAAEHLRALEAQAGPKWWQDDLKPWQPLCDIAEVYEATGELECAFEAFDQAMGALEARRASLSRDELKVALASDKGTQFLYFLAARTAVRAGHAARGFDYAERGKARSLLDLMALSRIPESPSRNGAMGAWREARMQLRLHQGLLAQARARCPADPDRVSALEARVAEDEAGLHTAEQALARVNPRFRDTVSQSAPTLSAAEVRRRLAAGSLLIEYAFLRDDLLVWAIAPDAESAGRRAPCDVGALERDMVAFHRTCERRQPYADLAERLAGILLAPIAEHTRKAERLVIVPHGAAHVLPFHALPFDGAPLGLSRTVSYLPSASALQWMETAPTGPLPKRVLAVGNPAGDLPAARRG